MQPFLNVTHFIPCKQGHQFILLLLLFLYFRVSCFVKNCKLCQPLALCVKCHHPETWSRFQTFFEYHCSNPCKTEWLNIFSRNGVSLWTIHFILYLFAFMACQTNGSEHSRKVFNERNAAILHVINLEDQRRWIFKKVTTLAKNLKFYCCIFKKSSRQNLWQL